MFVGGDLLRVALGRASHTPDKPEIRDPIVLVAFDKHNITPLHTYNPIYNYNIEVKKYNPKAVFSIYFSVVRMEKVAKSGNSISGGVNYFLWDRDHEGDCEFTTVLGDKRDTQMRKLNEFSTFVRYNSAVEIIHPTLPLYKK
mgnify:CR=1 FL=1